MVKNFGEIKPRTYSVTEGQTFARKNDDAFVKIVDNANERHMSSQDRLIINQPEGGQETTPSPQKQSETNRDFQTVTNSNSSGS